jgi:hypothetical protein
VLDLIADCRGFAERGQRGAFLKAFDPAMPGYAKLRENVTGLIAQGDVQSLIDPLEDEGDDRRRVGAVPLDAAQVADRGIGADRILRAGIPGQ